MESGHMIGEGMASVSVDVSTSSFMEEVVEASKSRPVIVDFWAPWCGPCKQLMPLLEKAVAAAGGKVKLAKVNIDENQAIAAQLRVQSVPTVYIFADGQPVDGFVGVKPESELVALVEQLAAEAQGEMSIDALLGDAEEGLAEKDFARSVASFQAVLQKEPEHEKAIAGLIRCLVGLNDVESARHMLENVPEHLKQSDAVSDAIKSLEFAVEAAKHAGALEQLRSAAEAAPDDMGVQYDLALAQYGAGHTAEAIATLLTMIRKDKAWNDEAARLQLLEIFSALGAAAPEVKEGRRQLSSLLFS